MKPAYLCQAFAMTEPGTDHFHERGESAFPAPDHSIFASLLTKKGEWHGFVTLWVHRIFKPILTRRLFRNRSISGRRNAANGVLVRFSAMSKCAFRNPPSQIAI
jgi:hypothetical protein